MCIRDRVFPGVHEPIISEDLFNHVQTQLKGNSRPQGRNLVNMPYGGLIQCQECGSSMSASYILKNKNHKVKKYFYYRCSKLSHRGWGLCSVRQINASRFHEAVYQNLLRVSMDKEYLNKLVYSSGEELRSTLSPGIEPQGHFENITAEKLGQGIQKFLNACARKTGIEKALALRRGIKRIHYSKTSVIVEFVCDPAFDGKTVSDSVSSAPALRVAPTDSPLRTPETKEPTPGLEVGPSALTGNRKWCPRRESNPCYGLERAVT